VPAEGILTAFKTLVRAALPEQAGPAPDGGTRK
jgi:hypothetical protein